MNASTRIYLTFFGIAAVLGSGLAARAAEVGQAAPDFTLTDLGGQSHRLSEYRGKTVVLEWVNPECPIVRKHYNKSGNIPQLQKTYTGQGVVWLSINSAAAGKEGDYDAAQARKWMEQVNAAPTDYFRDSSGQVGHLYGAKTTPHLFIINPEGTLVYAGGIDSIPTADPADIVKATNYVTEAMSELQSGKPISHPNTRPYGCSVKY
jgi:hypothetical protein